MPKGLATIFSLCVLFSTTAQADGENSQKSFAGTVGVSYEYGQLGDSGMELKDRAMGAFSLEALPGYRLNSKWVLGVDFNYRVQSQLDSLNNAGGTNLKGNAWLIGLGAQYRFDEKWALQAAVDILGQYKFDKQTADSEDDHLASPLSLRLKAQYFLKENFSADISANYVRWSSFHVGSVDNSQAASQWMIGVGVSYQFGSTKKIAEQVSAAGSSDASSKESVKGDKQ